MSANYIKISEPSLSAKNKRLWIFDLDHTLIAPKSGATFPKDQNDYAMIMTPKAIGPVDILIYSNQGSLNNNSDQLESFKNKVSVVMNKIKGSCSHENTRIEFFAALGKHNKYRKPMIFGLTELFDVSGYSEIFMCGDAAGRSQDFSDTDYKFLLNIKMFYTEIRCRFLVPEELVFDISENLPKKIHNPDICSIEYPPVMIQEPRKITADDLKGKRLIIMCGRQGSGKSYLELPKEFKVVTYKDKKGTHNKVSKLLASGNKVRVDGTFPSSGTRDQFAGLVKSDEVLIIYIRSSDDTCKHNRLYRENYLDEPVIPSIAVSMFTKNFEKPTKNVIEIDHRDRFISSDIWYNMYYY